MHKILLAEDEVMLRVVAAELLEAGGFKVFSAGNGEEALALLKVNPEIDLLISDVRMPRMDGYSLAEAGLKMKPALKVLMMTGYCEEPPPSLQARKIEVLRKPFNLDRLCEIASAVTAA